MCFAKAASTCSFAVVAMASVILPAASNASIRDILPSMSNSRGGGAGGVLADVLVEIGVDTPVAGVAGVAGGESTRVARKPEAKFTNCANCGFNPVIALG